MNDERVGMFQYVFSGESEWTEQRIKQLQVLKDIALKVTDVISQSPRRLGITQGHVRSFCRRPMNLGLDKASMKAQDMGRYSLSYA